MAQTKKLPWFRIYTNNRAAMENIDSAKLGDALKAALRYVDKGGQDKTIEQDITDPITLLAFGLLKQGADDSIEYHAQSVAAGKKGQRQRGKKKKKCKPPLTNYKANTGGTNRPRRK